MDEDFQKEIAEVRSQIDVLDKTLLELLKQRSDLVKTVTEIKKVHNATAHQPARFEQMLAKLLDKSAEIRLDQQLVREVWDAIHESSMRQQNITLQDLK